MPRLNSSCISRAEYDHHSGTLYLTFRNGRTYTLRRVPVELYKGLLASSSPGRYFNDHLRGRY